MIETRWVHVCLAVILAFFSSMTGAASAGQLLYTFSGVVTEIDDDAGAIAQAHLAKGDTVDYKFVVDFDAQATTVTNQGAVFVYVDTPEDDYFHARYVAGSALQKVGDGWYRSGGDIAAWHYGNSHIPDKTGDIVGNSANDKVLVHSNTTAPNQWVVGESLQVESYAYAPDGSFSLLRAEVSLAAVVAAPEPTALPLPDLTLLGVDDDSDALNGIDPQAGRSYLIGRLDPDGNPNPDLAPNLFAAPAAMAVRPSDQALFVYNNAVCTGTPGDPCVFQSTGELLMVDPGTGKAQRVDQSGISRGPLTTLAFRKSTDPRWDDKLYGFDNESILYNFYQGLSSFFEVGQMTDTQGHRLRIHGADFNDGGTLFLAATDLDEAGNTGTVRLYATPLANHADLIAKVIGDISLESLPLSITFLPNGSLVGSSENGKIFSLDPYTGAVCNIHDSRPWQGLGFAFPTDVQAGQWQYTFSGVVTEIDDSVGAIAEAGLHQGDAVSYAFVLDFNAQATTVTNDGAVSVYADTPTDDYFHARYVEGSALQPPASGANDNPVGIMAWHYGHTFLDHFAIGEPHRIIGNSDDDKVVIQSDTRAPILWDINEPLQVESYAYAPDGSFSLLRAEVTLQDIVAAPAPEIPSPTPGLALLGVEDYSDTLSSINPFTGLSHHIGLLDVAGNPTPGLAPNLFAAPAAMAVNPVDHTVYVYNNGVCTGTPGDACALQNTGELLVVDADTGEADRVDWSTPPQGPLTALAFNTNDNSLYGFDNESFFCQLDTFSGSAIRFGPALDTQAHRLQVHGADFNGGGTLFLAATDLDDPAGETDKPRLYAMEPFSASPAMVIGEIPVNSLPQSIAFEPNGTLVGSSADGRIYNIDPYTGAVFNQHDSQPWQGLGFVPSPLTRQPPAYAVIIAGDGDGCPAGTDAASLLATANQAYNRLRNLGLRDEDIRFFSNDPRQPIYVSTDFYPSRIIPIGSAIRPTLEAIEEAITVWAKDRMDPAFDNPATAGTDELAGIPADLYLVLVDCGYPVFLYVGMEAFSQLTPSWLAERLDLLQNGDDATPGLTGEAATRNIVTVLGVDHAGSFLKELAGPHRVTIADAAADETGSMGPLDPLKGEITGAAREGNYLVSEFFRGLFVGNSVLKSFEQATTVIESYTAADNLIPDHSPYNDSARQHPLLEDDGVSPYGSNTPGPAAGDGSLSGSVTIAPWPPDRDRLDDPEIIAVADPIILKPAADGSLLLWAFLRGTSRVADIWVEIKPPGQDAMTSTSLAYESHFCYITSPEEPVACPTQGDPLYESGNYEIRYELQPPATLFTAPGTYQLFHFARDQRTGRISLLQRTLVYRQSEKDREAPSSFDLLEPAGSPPPVLRSDSDLLARWETASDPDGVTYTIEIREDPLDERWQKETFHFTLDGLAEPFAVITPAAGFVQPRSYIWQVIAIDSLGAATISRQNFAGTPCGFTIDDASGLSSRGGVIVHVSDDTSALPGADVTWKGDAPVIPLGDNAFLAASTVPGTYTMWVTAPYHDEWSGDVVISPGRIDEMSVTLAASLNTIATVNLVPGSGTYSGPLDVSIIAAGNYSEIRYTLDGSMPTTSSALYDKAIRVFASATVKARAFLNAEGGLAESASYLVGIQDRGELCDDLVDNDLDGMIDCQDLGDCVNSPFCTAAYSLENPPGDGGLTVDTRDPYEAARAIGMGEGLEYAVWMGPDGSASINELGHGLMDDFGVVTALDGERLLALSTGLARTPGDAEYRPGSFDAQYESGAPTGFPKESPACAGVVTGTPHDGIGLKVRLRVPAGITGLSFDTKFYTSEFPSFICSTYNDMYTVLMDPPPAGLADGNILFDSQGNPMSVNAAFLEVCEPQETGGKNFDCSLGTGDLEGTGFEGHGATGWLEVKTRVIPEQTIELFFVIWDSGDGLLDSTALIDNFRWLSNYTGDTRTRSAPDTAAPSSFFLYSPDPANATFKSAADFVASWQPSRGRGGITYTLEIRENPSDQRWQGKTFRYTVADLTENYYVLGPAAEFKEPLSYIWQVTAIDASGASTVSTQNFDTYGEWQWGFTIDNGAGTDNGWITVTVHDGMQPVGGAEVGGDLENLLIDLGNGVFLGTVPKGIHTLQVSRAGYETWNRSVAVEADRHVPVEVLLHKSSMGDATPEPPLFRPPPGIYGMYFWLVIKSPTPGAEIRYTTDGSEPNALSPLYTGPFPLTASTDFRAKAFKDGWYSATSTASYTLELTDQDSDGDGVSDAAEMLHFGSLLISDGTRDYDGDGISDYDELMIYGTSPILPMQIPDTGQVDCFDDQDQLIFIDDPDPSAYPSNCYDEVDGHLLDSCLWMYCEGQDMMYQGPRSYTKMASNGVELPRDATLDDGWSMTRDNVTGLVWEIKTNDGSIHDSNETFTWCDTNPESNGGDAGACDNNANTEIFIETLNTTGLGGFSDWRLPTQDELRFIVDYGRENPAATVAYFPNTQPDFYWSSSVFDNESVLGIGFVVGDEFLAMKAAPHCVRAVHSPGSREPEERVRFNSDGTVTDTATGLLWSQSTDLSEWQLALRDGVRSNLAGFDDWRLPSINELMSTADFVPRVYPYWSSTTYTPGSEGAWGMDFGHSFVYYKWAPLLVRQVRSLQPEEIDICPDDPIKLKPFFCGCGVEDIDSDNDGFYGCLNDCNDADGAINPDATEICDGVDNNCDGRTDEGVTNACGSCGTPPDLDSDGTPDCLDGCPLDPDNDIDGDGICGDKDNFPDKPIQPGDLDNDGSIDLRDAILALQVVSGLQPLPVMEEADVNEDTKVGLAETIYILRNLSGTP